MTEKNRADKAVYKIMIDAPIDRVWTELVKTDEILPFFFGAICRLPNGHVIDAPMAMETPNGKYRSVVGKVLEFSPPHRYAHTLKFTNMDEEPCTVTYDLKEVEGGVEFTLTTTNVPVSGKTAKSLAQGGPFIVKTLKSICETGQPHFGARMMLAMFGLMAPMTPKACRSENWSFDRISQL